VSYSDKSEYQFVRIDGCRRMVLVKGVKEYAVKLFCHFAQIDLEIELVKLNARIDPVDLVVPIPWKV
jgi:hypothetical protein